MPYLAEQAVTPGFREAIACLLPRLCDNAAYWKMTGYLLFGAGYQQELLIPAELIATIEGKKPEGKNPNGKYSAKRFLAEYQRDIVKFDMTPHHINICRTITHVYWSEEIERLANMERRTRGGDRVEFSSGVRWRASHGAKEREKAQNEALEQMQEAGIIPAQKLLDILNFAPVNRFNRIKKHLPEAARMIDSLNLDENENRRQHNILQAIEAQAQPMYQPVSRSARIFVLNDSICRLRREARKIMTQDWISADLRSAQLAIVAKVWGIPEVTDFLRSGKSIWRELCDWMGMTLEDGKPMLKNALYGVTFGAGRDKLIGILESRSRYKRFRSHPLIHILLSTRAKQLRQIRKDKHGIDAFGRRIDISYMIIPGKSYMYDSSRKILALIAQSYELLLLQPVVDLADTHKKSKHGFMLLSWLHDGFCFDVADQTERASWIKRLQAEVKQQADALGIETELEIE